MNFKLLSACFGAILLSCHTSFGQVTNTPKVDEQSAPYVKIKRVELTDNHTIIHLQFIDKKTSQPEFRSLPRMQPFPDSRPQQKQQPDGGQIWLDPDTRLYKPGEIDKKFKFIRAENIPTTSRMNVASGDTVDFVAYFERLSPGIEEFDFYEGRSAPGQQSWNFYGVHIKNPLKKEPAAAKSTTKTTVPAKKPAVKAPEKPSSAKQTEKDPSRAFSMVNGTVYDARTKRPIPARITYIEKGDTLQVQSSSGKYRIGLDPGEKYDFRATARGYYGSSFNLVPGDSANQSGFNRDLYLTPLIVGETILLPNIYFETSKYTLLPESFDELNRLVEVMQDNPSIEIRVEGHTDNVGDFDKNLELSRQRAEAVKAYLTDKGINDARVEAKGYGGTRPVRKGSEEERKKNRRVEFVITQM